MVTHFSVVPTGLLPLAATDPAMNGWAILDGPYGTFSTAAPSPFTISRVRKGDLFNSPLFPNHFHAFLPTVHIEFIRPMKIAA